MKKHLTVFLLLPVLLFSACATDKTKTSLTLEKKINTSNSDQTGQAIITVINPGVIKKLNSKAESTIAESGSSIAIGTFIETDATGRALLIFPDNSSILLEPKTKITVAKVKHGTETKTSLIQAAGSTWSKVTAGQPDSYEVQTNTLVAAVRGTEFSVDVLDDKALVSVEDGTVQTSATDLPALAVSLKRGERIQMTQAEIKSVSDMSIGISDKIAAMKSKIKPLVETQADQKIYRDTVRACLQANANKTESIDDCFKTKQTIIKNLNRNLKSPNETSPFIEEKAGESLPELMKNLRTRIQDVRKVIAEPKIRALPDKAEKNLDETTLPNLNRSITPSQLNESNQLRTETLKSDKQSVQTPEKQNDFPIEFYIDREGANNPNYRSDSPGFMPL